METSVPWRWPCPEDTTWMACRTTLLTSGAESSKNATNRLKKLICESYCGDASTRFWSDYFELFEVLEQEKQSHLVQPVLKDKMRIFKSLSEGDNDGNNGSELCAWLLVILAKMIHHDNRDIVKEGLIRFLSLGENKEVVLKLNVRVTLLKFLEEQAFPLIRDHVGWVLSDAAEYFELTHKFGVFLRNVYPNNDEMDELRILSVILNFIVQDGICRSPAALVFVVRALGHGIYEEKRLRCNDDTSCTSWDLTLVDQSIFLLNKAVSQGLTSANLFLKFEIEQTFINILVNRILPMLEALDRNIKWCDPDSATLYNILAFCGTVPLEKLMDHAERDIKCFSWFNDKCGRLLPTLHESECLEFQKMNGLQLKGCIRMVWFSAQDKNAVKYTIFNALCKELQCNCDLGLGDRFKSISEALEEFTGLVSTAELNRDTINFEKNRYIQIQRGLDVQKKFAEGLSTMSANFEKTLFVQQIQNIALLDILLKPSRTSSNYEVFIDETALSKVFDGLTSDSPDCLANSTHTEFLVWKFLGVLPLPLIPRFQPYLSNIINMFLKTSSLAVTDFWVFNGTDLRTQFYQVKFKGLADFLITCRNTKENDVEIPSASIPDIDLWGKILSYIIDNIDKSGFGGVTPATRCVRSMVDFVRCYNREMFKNMCNDVDIKSKLKEYMDLSWNLIFEMKKTESFRTAFNEFTLLLAYPCFEEKGMLTMFSNKVFKESSTVIGLPHALMESLLYSVTSYKEIINCEKCYDSSTLQEIVQVSLHASLSGAPIPKNCRVAYKLWRYLLQKRTNDSADNTMTNCDFAKSPMVRIIGLQILQTVLAKLHDNQLKIKILDQIVQFLLDKNDEDGYVRYFGNSVMHRKKLRIAQALLVLQPYFDIERNTILLNRLLVSLSEESPQPSVRYLIEWIIVLVLANNRGTWVSFFTKCIQCWTHRIGFGSHFSSICLHTVSILLCRAEESYYFCEQSLVYLSQLLLGYHATVRVYAQVCFQKIFELLRSLGAYPELLGKFEVIFTSLQAAEKYYVGTSAKVLQGLQNDFYIQIFNPVTHYTKDVIFIHLPKISDMTIDELPIEDCLLNCGINSYESSLFKSVTTSSIYSRDDLKELYLKHEKTTWHLRITPVESHEVGEELRIQNKSVNEICPSANFQRKINPWKTLTISESRMDSMSEEFVVKKRAAMEDGLIVVASLIDRIPNLGGLCRSCEIFGVSKYVISSINILNDQQFQNMAVSSQNWIDICEVPPKDLQSFLETYKAKGYDILGIEQAQESTRLNDFKFPRKSLLVLGNEKYGIPSNLLHLVDHCLEIPQVGITRSLNVHVTGALCIWDYSRQHSL